MGNHFESCHFEERGRKLEDNINMNIREICCEYGTWMDLVQESFALNSVAALGNAIIG
jgi:hypothetical protein